MSLFCAFIGSNPPSLTLFAFLYRRKEKRFVHRRLSPENEKPDSDAANRPLRSPISLCFARFFPKSRKKHLLPW